MARWLNNGIGEGGTTATCSSCHITQTVNVYDGQIKYRYCPYCGARMEDVDTSGPMTADEFHVKRVVPARMEVRLLEKDGLDATEKKRQKKRVLTNVLVTIVLALVC